MSKTQSKLAITLSEATCCCWLGIYYYQGSLFDPTVLQVHLEGCGGGGEIFWQQYDPVLSQWDTVPGDSSAIFEEGLVYDPLGPEGFGPGIYRVKYATAGCCDTYSSIIEAYAPV